VSEGPRVVQKTPLPWLWAGLFLGLVQVVAVAVHKPLGVSTEFVVAGAAVINQTAPDYVRGHPLIKDRKYQKPGYGSWLDVGLVAGALLAAVATRRWKLRSAPVWWEANRGRSVTLRFVVCFVGGFLILLGARFAHGCTSGQFASGWAQLALSALPFTITFFGFGMLTALLVYKKSPDIER